MDDIVRQAMAKWPHVPACYGWLGLDGRGRWFMRDDQAQQRGSFSSQRPGSQGHELQHTALLLFIGRNYSADEQGQWYFQNGPQRVYVELSHTPYVWRIEPDGTVCAHTGASTEVQQVWLDEQGLAYLQTGLGFGHHGHATPGNAHGRPGLDLADPPGLRHPRALWVCQKSAGAPARLTSPARPLRGLVAQP
jgi:Protein of unknown function (DUF2946)